MLTICARHNPESKVTVYTIQFLVSSCRLCFTALLLRPAASTRNTSRGVIMATKTSLSFAGDTYRAALLRSIGPVTTHPLTIAVFLVCHCAVMIGFTSPDSLLRLASLPLQPLVASLLFRTEVMSRWGTGTNTLVASFILSMPLQYLDLVLLSKWSFANQGPTRFSRSDKRHIKSGTAKEGAPASKDMARPDSIWSRLRFGLATTVSTRHLNTPYEARNCPHFSEKDKNYTPSRSSYLLKTLGIVVVTSFAVDFFFAINGLEGATISISTAKIPFFSRLNAVTLPEIIERLVISGLSFINTYLIVQAGYGLAGLLAVGSGISNVRDFRPVVGDISLGYTIRKFWG